MSTVLRSVRAPVLVACLAWSSVAGAEPSAADRALASELFRSGRALVADGKSSEACRKFEESQRLDPSAGTLLNLAVCHEKEGRTASAWSELNESLAIARRDGRADREQLAKEHLAALEPRISRLTIDVPPDVAALPGLRVLRDGTAIGGGAWGVAMPVDPGAHVIVAEAEGRERWSATLAVGADADRQSVTVPILEALPAPAPAPAPDPPPPVAVSFVQPPAREPDSTPPSVVPIVVAGGVALVAGGLGTYFGLSSFAKRSESDSLCTPTCGDAGVARNDEAKTAADVSTAMFVVAGAAAAVTIYLVVTRPRSRATVQLSPVVHF